MLNPCTVAGRVIVPTCQPPAEETETHLSSAQSPPASQISLGSLGIPPAERGSVQVPSLGDWGEEEFVINPNFLSHSVAEVAVRYSTSNRKCNQGSKSNCDPREERRGMRLSGKSGMSDTGREQNVVYLLLFCVTLSHLMVWLDFSVLLHNKQ